MGTYAWRRCLDRLQEELPAQQFNTWIRPLQARVDDANLVILAPNRYVRDKVEGEYLEHIRRLISSLDGIDAVELAVGTREREAGVPLRAQPIVRDGESSGISSLNRGFVFDDFVEGKSNELAKAAARQVAANAGKSYNPLFLYGDVGLGKTHLMHAVGNAILAKEPNANVVYLYAQRFVNDMVNALRTGTIQDVMTYYRSIDVLLIDDIQFFADKLRSQEEFFHVFNALLEQDHQMVLTCDRYPREIQGLEERLKSRFAGGLTVEVQAPDLETRVAILIKKAEAVDVELDSDVAFHVAERIRSNVRELEGALQRVIASAKFTGAKITVDLVRRSLHDLFAIQERQVTVDAIQRIVAEYYNIKHSDLLSKRRNRTIARPRQIAMSLAKSLTNHSLPEIGELFGGRDHTTVLHACRKVNELRESSPDIAEDYKNLSRLLST